MLDGREGVRIHDLRLRHFSGSRVARMANLRRWSTSGTPPPRLHCGISTWSPARDAEIAADLSRLAEGPAEGRTL